MDYKTATTAMRKYFKDNFTTAPVVLPDMPSNYEDTPWVRFNILHTDGYQSTMGDPTNNRFERSGIITVQIFTPQGGNGVVATNLANEALKLYEGVYNSGIFYYDAYVKEVGNDGRGWYQINVLTQFKYEEIT